MDLDAESAREEVLAVAPELARTSVRYLGEGMDSRAFLVDDAIVFRFAKHAEAGTRMEREVRVLPRLAPRVSLSIPRFSHVGRRHSDGLPFVGYPLLRGVPFDRQVFEGLTPEARGDVLDALARFIAEVRAFPLAEARDLGVEHGEPWTNSIREQIDAREHVYPLLRPDEHAGLERLFEDFLGDPANFRSEPTLLHADLSPEHLVFSPELRRLTGVIDFGDLTVGDPDYEFIYLFQDLGPEATRAVADRLSHPDPRRLFRKLHYYSVVNAVEDVVEGLKRGDAALRDESLSWFRRLSASGFSIRGGTEA